MQQKYLTIKDVDFDKVIRPYTDNGWKVEKATRISDSTSQYVLTKPDISKKIKG